MKFPEHRDSLAADFVSKLESEFTSRGIEFFRTGENLNTLTFQISTFDSKPIYGSLKLTIHKQDYNLDNEIENFELFFEEKAMKKKLKEEKLNKKELKK